MLSKHVSVQKYCIPFAIICLCHTSLAISVCSSNSGAIALHDMWIENELPIFISNVACNGTEDSILNCPHTQGLLNCAGNDASVMCLCKYLPSLLSHLTHEKLSFITTRCN